MRAAEHSPALSLRQLQAFRTVIATGTMTRAAEAMSTSQPAISAMIAALEREVGFKLFFRRGSALVPTPEGMAFDAEAQTALLGIERVKRVAVDIRNRRRGGLRVAACSWLGSGYLPELVTSFARAHPGIEIQICPIGSTDVSAALLEETTDIWMLDASASHPLLESEEHVVSCVCVLPQSHPLAESAVLNPDLLRGMAHVAPPRDNPLAAQVEEAFACAGVRLRTTIRAESFATVCSLVSFGLGFGLVDEITARHLKPLGLTIRPFAPTIALTLAAMHRTDRQVSIAARSFLDAHRRLIGAVQAEAGQAVAEKIGSVQARAPS